ncbi:hypothetical protein PRUB_a2168 [Pseudoalteromonas rubra]|uniref:Uncharacterized protein n=1 Tax=Pseudoalteromonas rubra TaxID=43658 RepID=A0A8T0CE95_9GAMM|nr:hypothetical protein PRUB_a2168 [Pseudoalteromonas rubra]
MLARCILDISDKVPAQGESIKQVGVKKYHDLVIKHPEVCCF